MSFEVLLGYKNWTEHFQTMERVWGRGYPWQQASLHLFPGCPRALEQLFSLNCCFTPLISWLVGSCGIGSWRAKLSTDGTGHLRGTNYHNIAAGGGANFYPTPFTDFITTDDIWVCPRSALPLLWPSTMALHKNKSLKCKLSGVCS